MDQPFFKCCCICGGKPGTGATLEEAWYQCEHKLMCSPSPEELEFNQAMYHGLVVVLESPHPHPQR